MAEGQKVTPSVMTPQMGPLLRVTMQCLSEETRTLASIAPGTVTSGEHGHMSFRTVLSLDLPRGTTRICQRRGNFAEGTL